MVWGIKANLQNNTSNKQTNTHTSKQANGIATKQEKKNSTREITLMKWNVNRHLIFLSGAWKLVSCHFISCLKGSCLKKFSKDRTLPCFLSNEDSFSFSFFSLLFFSNKSLSSSEIEDDFELFIRIGAEKMEVPTEVKTHEFIEDFQALTFKSL